MTVGLTARQDQALAFVKAFIRDKNQSPVLQEIGDALGIKGRGAVHGIMRGLRERGYVRWTKGRQRSLVVLPEAPGAFVLPPDIHADLARWCAAHDELAADVVEDAVRLHLEIVERWPLWHRWFAWRPVLAIDFAIPHRDGPMPPKRLVWLRCVLRRWHWSPRAGRSCWQYQVE